jgi:hypothetical protein
VRTRGWTRVQRWRAKAGVSAWAMSVPRLHMVSTCSQEGAHTAADAPACSARHSSSCTCACAGSSGRGMRSTLCAGACTAQHVPSQQTIRPSVLSCCALIDVNIGVWVAGLGPD